MNQARGTSEWDDIYGGGFGGYAGAQLMQVPLDILDPWMDPAGNQQPFRPYTGEQLKELAENITLHGVITPIHIRPKGDRYEILAGHNRCAAAKLAGLTMVPAVVESMDDYRAAEILVDSNLLQRQKILPSEKARAYKLKMDAMKHQGRSLDNTRSDEVVAKDSDESRASVQRYLRLNYLTEKLLEMVDEEKLTLTAAVDVSFLPQNIQNIVSDIMEYEEKKVNAAKAKALKKAMPETEEEVRAVLDKNPNTPSVSVKVDFPELESGDTDWLMANADFLKEARIVITDLAVRYLKERIA